MLHSPPPKQMSKKAEPPLSGPPGLIEQTAKRLLALFALFLAIIFPVSVARGQVTTTITDDFASGSYTVGSGWLGAWIDEESGAATPTTGNIRVESGRVRLYQSIAGGGGLYRDFSIPQAAFTVRTLTFNYAGNTGNDSVAPSDLLIVELSSNGGASYTTVASLHRNLTTTISSGTINLTGITGPGNYRIRFRNSDGAQTSEDYYVDDVRITVTGTLPSATTDFGDWNGSGAATTTTSSTVSNGLRLGATSDAEASVTPNAAANADGADEDGVSLPSRLIAGSMASLYAQFTNTTGSNAFINAWVDFNRNGSFADAGEQVATNLSATAGVTDGTASIGFLVPAGASAGSTGVRIRLTSTSSPGATGASGIGEVEDYITTIAAVGAAGLSPMQDYNVIVRNNMDVLSDVEGRVMVRNFINPNSVTLAMKLDSYASTTQTVQLQTNAVAGSALNLQFGSFYAPSAGALNGRTINYNGGGTFQTTPAPNFTSVFDGIVTTSASYAAMAANNTITIPGSPSTLTLSVTTLDANGVAIFSVDGNTLLNNPNIQQIRPQSQWAHTHCDSDQLHGHRDQLQRLRQLCW
jgi:hypothetical protein